MISYEKIKPYIEKKLISEVCHPDNQDIRIFNYTPECQFSCSWDEVTKQCRGLIINIKTEEILARPFPKFFNYEEHLGKNWPIPVSQPVITEKLDGSLGISYELNGKFYISTRGSFISSQAIWATKWYRKNNLKSVKGITDLFEIIYPENRIVLNYDFSGLVHLASIDIKTGKQVERNLPIKKAEKIQNYNFQELMKLDGENKEGFVVYFPEENERIKIKFPEYVRLHKIITGVSERGIWEMMMAGSSLNDLLNKVPDEFYNWVKRVQGELETKYMDIQKEAFQVYSEAYPKSTRKEQALFIIANTKYPGVAFAILDKEDYKKIIWKIIKPAANKSFKQDEINNTTGVTSIR